MGDGRTGKSTRKEYETGYPPARVKGQKAVLYLILDKSSAGLALRKT